MDPKEGTYNYAKNVTQEQKDASRENVLKHARKHSKRQYQERKASGEAQEYDRKWSEKNKDRLKDKYKDDPIYRMRKLLMSHMNRDVEKKRIKSVEEILGISYESFIEYLGPQKEKDQLDHIVPLSWAQSDEEIFCLQHYSNFQYLNRFANRAKSDKFAKKENVEKVLEFHNNVVLLQKIIDRNLDKIS